jgi:hypothetical protein
MKRGDDYLRLSPWQASVLTALLVALSLGVLLASLFDLPNLDWISRRLRNPAVRSYLLESLTLAFFATTVTSVMLFQCGDDVCIPQWLFPVRGRWLEYLLAAAMALAVLALMLFSGPAALAVTLALWGLLLGPVVLVRRLLEPARS